MKSPMTVRSLALALPVALSLFTSSWAWSTNLRSMGGQQRLLRTTSNDDKGGAVPGDNPLHYCKDQEQSEDFLVIEHVNLNPNPPVPGQNLTIEAAGVFKKEVEKGAYVHLSVKYGLIRIVQTTADLCEQIENVHDDDFKCPIEPGESKLNKTIELPAQIPPGTYTVEADIFSKHDEHIVCLTAHVEFPRH
ncbi:MAG: Phosphatidylglycerol/phosphatidylinositol transfer protein [Watsoniomyces obsoletus]|nr:MAG: Phosphatidylglycerol/phosphatidylinositol transfer protein [Watsoniomyces obsoletus]